MRARLQRHSQGWGEQLVLLEMLCKQAESSTGVNTLQLAVLQPQNTKGRPTNTYVAAHVPPKRQTWAQHDFILSGQKENERVQEGFWRKGKEWEGRGNVNEMHKVSINHKWKESKEVNLQTALRATQATRAHLLWRSLFKAILGSEEKTEVCTSYLSDCLICDYFEPKRQTRRNSGLTWLSQRDLEAAEVQEQKRSCQSRRMQASVPKAEPASIPWTLNASGTNPETTVRNWNIPKQTVFKIKCKQTNQTVSFIIFRRHGQSHFLRQ